ncbi:MAG: hypothetical protein QW356_07470, partial [Candidatus Hadarchaeales archaeon]
MKKLLLLLALALVIVVTAIWKRGGVSELSAPSILSQKVQEGRAELSWTFKGDRAYRLQVSTDPDFRSIFLERVLSTSRYSFDLPPGIYYCRVREEKEGKFGQWSRTVTLVSAVPISPPTLLSPENGSVQESAEVLFVWQGDEGISFRLQVSARPDFTTLVYENTTTEQFLQTFLETGEYYWRVRGENAGTWGEWSPTWNLKIMPSPAVPVPLLTSPSKGSRLTSASVTLAWVGRAGLTYHLQVDNEPSFSPPLLHENEPAENSYTCVLPEGTYYWRVRAENGGRFSEWSESWDFTISLPAISPPVLKAPRPGARLTSLPITFSWTGGAGLTY